MKRPLAKIVAELEKRIKANADDLPFPTAVYIVDEGDLSRLCEAVRCAENLSYVVFGASSNASVNDANKRSALAEWDKIAGGSDEI